MYDIIIIGGGVIGCSILRELSHYNCKILLLEKDEDVSTGCSKANSGIIHAGYDAENNTLKARFNVEGNNMYPQLCKEMHVPYKNIGSLVLSKKEGLLQLEELMNRGILNGVLGLEILNRAKLHEIEPNIADEIEYGLYAPTAGIVSPYEYTIACAEHGIINGGEVLLDKDVCGVKYIDNHFEVITSDGNKYFSEILINAAGYFSQNISEMLSEDYQETVFKRGDYYIFDHTELNKFKHTLFPLPDEKGKGVLVSPTADGNIIAGPTSIKVNRGNDTAVSQIGLDIIKESTISLVKNLNFKKAIRVFAGVRSSCTNDFIIENGKNKKYIKLQGICSPGLTSAPAIAKYIAEELLHVAGFSATKKQSINYMQERPITRNLSEQEWQDLIEKDKTYSKIVCRCEKITEGEILSVLNSPLPPKSLDALKRRVRTGMGRCQGGFCSSKIMDIISKFYGTSINFVTKNGKGSEIILSDIKPTFEGESNERI